MPGSVPSQHLTGPHPSRPTSVYGTRSSRPVITHWCHALATQDGYLVLMSFLERLGVISASGSSPQHSRSTASLEHIYSISRWSPSLPPPRRHFPQVPECYLLLSRFPLRQPIPAIQQAHVALPVCLFFIYSTLIRLPTKLPVPHMFLRSSKPTCHNLRLQGWPGISGCDWAEDEDLAGFGNPSLGTCRRCSKRSVAIIRRQHTISSRGPSRYQAAASTAIGTKGRATRRWAEDRVGR